jgi:phosphoribosylglycinamide formyltransferase
VLHGSRANICNHHDTLRHLIMAAAELPAPCNVLVMASGNGTNFQALIDAVGPGRRIPDARIDRLVVNRKQAYAVQRAEQAGIPWDYFNLIANGYQQKGEKDEAKLRAARARFDEGLAALLLGLDPRPDLVVLAGWMQVFTKAFLDPVKKEGIEVINLHPGLPRKCG